MKKTTRHVIDEMIKEKQWQKDNGEITRSADDLWEYSGETEQTQMSLTEDNIKMRSHMFYRKRNIYTFLSKTEADVIEYFHLHPDKPASEVSKILNMSAYSINKILTKFLKLDND